MHARISDHLPDLDVGFLKRRVGRRFVAGLPGEDVVVVLALAVRTVGLVLEILTDHRRVRRHRFERVDVDRKRLVFHLDQIGGVSRDIAVLRDHKGHFLILEQHFAVGQHHLHVAGKRRHPGEVDGLERLGGNHRNDAGYRGSLRRIDLLDAGVSVRRAIKVAVEHSRQLHVVDVTAFALNKTDVLDALSFAAHAFKFDGAFGRGGGHVVHSAASWNGTPLILAAAN